LHQRIKLRLHRLLEAGLVNEVRSLLAAGVPPEAPGLDAVGYREVIRHARGELSVDALPAAIEAATRRYAKRQETWFRNQLGGHPVLTLDATESPVDLATRVATEWERRRS
jgi:tRNA dimethylallyltransferase